jgi:iron complex transport system ATP-binding protein
MLKVEALKYQIGAKGIIQDLTVQFQPGEFNMILGPNGSGKSTFLRLCSGELQPDKGVVYYGDQQLTNHTKAAMARRRAVLSQHSELTFPLSVSEVVMMGRYPHFEHNPGQKDTAICKEAMATLDIFHLASRNYLTLSGGERQRVHFARVLAQIWEMPEEGYRYLFLDEPMGHLDIKYQHAFLQLSRQLLNERTVLIAVMHDVNLSIQYADKLLFLKEGSIQAYGMPEQVVSSSLIEDVFSVHTTIIKNPISAKPHVIYEQ